MWDSNQYSPVRRGSPSPGRSDAKRVPPNQGADRQPSGGERRMYRSTSPPSAAGRDRNRAHTAAESREGSPYMAGTSFNSGTGRAGPQPQMSHTSSTASGGGQSAATYRPGGRAGSQGQRGGYHSERGRNDSNPPSPRRKGESGSFDTPHRSRAMSQDRYTNLGQSVSTKPTGGGSMGVLGGSVGIPGAPGMPLSNQPPSRQRDPLRQRSISDGIASFASSVGGSVGISGRAGRGDRPGGSAGQAPRSRSFTDSAAFGGRDQQINYSDRLRNESPIEEGPEGTATLSLSGIAEDRPRGYSQDRDFNQSGESYVPRKQSEAQAAMSQQGYASQGSASAYTALDRVNAVDIERDGFGMRGMPPPVAEPDERDTSWLIIGFMTMAWGFCVFSWILGISQPVSELNVMPGTPLHWRMVRSLVHTLSDLIHKRLWFAFGALGFFSLVVPISKLVGTGFLIHKLRRRRAGDVHATYKIMIHTMGYLASYQFVDLYSGILFVVYFNCDASNASFEVGFYWFFSYCCVSLLLTVLLEYVLMEAAHDGGPNEGVVNAPLLAKLPDPTRYAAVSAGRDRARSHSGDQEIERSQMMPNSAAPSNLPVELVEKYPDLMSTRFFTGCFFFLFIICFWGGFLEVRMLEHTVAVERTVMSLKEIVVEFLPLHVHFVVQMALWAFIVFIPFIFAIVQLVRVEHRQWYSDKDWTFMGLSVHTVCQTWTRTVAEMLRQWAHVDVFAVACLIFLFMIQDDYTLTMVPDGSYAFYLFLAASFSFFFLRWFVEGEMGEQVRWASGARSVSLIGVFVVLTMFIWGGVPGAAPHFQYRTLGSVCEHVQPFLHKVTSNLPATYGNCDDTDSNPPQPCMGSENLQSSGDDKEYMNAVWMGGLRTMNINNCAVSRSEGARPGTSVYQFNIAGQFDKLKMFLRVKQCMALGGCVKMNSADHCCGDDISFNFTFALDCRESSGSANAIRSLRLVKADFGKMLVHQELLHGTVKIQAMDISGQVESSVKGSIDKVLHTKIPWGHQHLSMADMINKIVQYNAPSDVGQCL